MSRRVPRISSHDEIRIGSRRRRAGQAISEGRQAIGVWPEAAQAKMSSARRPAVEPLLGMLGMDASQISMMSGS
jgi:hypothetical protein